MKTPTHRGLSLAAAALAAAGVLAVAPAMADDPAHPRHGGWHDDRSSDDRSRDHRSRDHRSWDDDSSDDRGRHVRRGPRYGHDWRWRDGHVVLTRRFDVPIVIVERRHVRHYAPYHHGRVYHRGHRHAHEVYAFPVLVDGRVHHRPHAYCGGRLYDRHLSFHGRRVGVSLSF